MKHDPVTTGTSANSSAAADPGWRDAASAWCLRTASVLAGALGISPSAAYAATDVTGTLTSVLNILSNGIQLLGAIVIVMGLVNLGQSLKDQGGGERLASALSMIVGGIVVSAAGTYFKTIDTNIAG